MAKIQLRIRPVRFWIERMLRRYRCRGRQLGANTARLALIYITSCGCVYAMFTSDLPDPCLSGPPQDS
jgi:hypothetical protein